MNLAHFLKGEAPRCAKEGENDAEGIARTLLSPKTHGKSQPSRSARFARTKSRRKQNRAFAPAHPICRKAHAGKVKGRAYKKVCPEKARPEENLRGQRRCRVPVGLSSDHGNFFRQLERNFVNKELLWVYSVRSSVP